MAEETIFTDLDFTGGEFEQGSALSLGTRFHVTQAGAAKRARFYAPGGGVGGGSVSMRLHRVSDNALLATATFSSITDGAWNETNWIVGGSPGTVALATSTVYSTSYVTPSRYVASTGYTWPKVSGGLHLVSEAPGGYFADGDAMPDGTFGNNNYYADTVVEFSESTTPVTGSVDLRWQTRVQAIGTTDLRWSVYNRVTGSTDLRWQVRNAVSASLDLQWAVRNAVTGSLDARWAVLNSVTGSLDARWQVRAEALGSVDLRWTAAGSVSNSLDVRWAVKGVVTGTLDVRWAVSNQITASLDVRWQTRQRATGTVDLRWVVDGEVFVPKSDVRAYLSQRVRARPTIAQIRAYL
jgi:hypothetical protein